MPRFDGTGPQGMGPRTGRGMGPCGRGLGLGFGMCPRFGRGRGRGLGRYFGWGAPLNKNEEIEDLKEYKKALEEELEDVNKSLSEVKKEE